MSERETVKNKIAKLMNLGTSSNVAEAGIALAKATDLMEKWGLELSDIELRDQRIVKSVIKTGRKTRHDLHSNMMRLAEFCTVKVWFQSSHRYIKGSEYEVHLIGYEEDVETFKHFWTYFERVLNNELDGFYVSDTYKNKRTHGRSLRSAFIMGFNDRLNNLLAEKASEKQSFKTRSGTAIVPLKMGTIENWFEENTGIKLKRTRSYRHLRTYSGYNDGQAAANNVSFNTPVNGGGSERKLLT